MNPETSSHDSSVAAISLLPEMSDDGQHPRDAIRVLVPGDGPGISVAYKSDGCPERNACSMEIEREPDVTARVSQRAERISGAAAELHRTIDALSRLYDDETPRRG